MKTFLKCAVAVKTHACLLFTGFMAALAVVYGLILDWPITWALILEVLALSLACSVVQFVFFSGVLLRKMAYLPRMLCSLPAFLAVVAGAGMIFRWFPIDRWQSWVTFLSIFAVIFVAIAVGFEVYFRITGQKYDGLLKQYKDRQ